jgi:hypothetical protein
LERGLHQTPERHRITASSPDGIPFTIKLAVDQGGYDEPEVALFGNSAEVLRAQAIDFAYGNGHFEDPRITREGVARAHDELADQDRLGPAKK